MHEAGYGKLAGNLQKGERAGYIGLNNGRWLIDAAVDMRFGRKMDNRVAATHGHFERLGITDVAFCKCVIGMACDRIEIGEVSGIGQVVVIDDGMASASSKDMANEVGADESRATGNQDFHEAPFRAATARQVSSLSLLAPVSATRLLASRSDLKVPASVHHPSRDS